jgi:hypothetical protein
MVDIIEVDWKVQKWERKKLLKIPLGWFVG